MNNKTLLLSLLAIACIIGGISWGLNSIDGGKKVHPGDLVLSVNLEALENSRRRAYMTLSRTVFMKNWFNFGVYSSMRSMSVEVALPNVAIPPDGVTRREVCEAVLSFLDHHGLLIPGLELRFLNRKWPGRLFSLLFSPRITTPLTGNHESREDFFFSTENNAKFLAAIHRQGGRNFIYLDVPPKNQTMNPSSKGHFLLALIAKDGGIALSEFVERNEPVGLLTNFPDDFKYVPESFSGPYVFLAYLDGDMVMNAKATVDSEGRLLLLETR